MTSTRPILLHPIPSPADSPTDEKFSYKASKWLNMMYPRLYLARHLLSDQGVLLVSTDDNEVHNLRFILNEIFGEENLVNVLAVSRRVKSLNVQFEKVQTLNQAFEYILVYRKTDAFAYARPLKAAGDQRREGYWNSFWNNADRPTMRYEIDAVRISKGQWKWEKSRGMRALDNYKRFMAEVGDEAKLADYWKANAEDYLKATGHPLEFVKPAGKTAKYWVSPSETTIMDSNLMEYYVNDDTARRRFFVETVKNPELITQLVQMSIPEDGIVLDFFAGSGTTAQAVLTANAADGGSRRFILIQLPEPTPEDSEARRAGFSTISGICEERIRRVIKQLMAGQGSESAGGQNTSVDIGFRVYKLAESNFKVWVSARPQDVPHLQRRLSDHVHHIREGRSDQDILTELLLKSGFPPTIGISEVSVGGKKAFKVTDGRLVVCLDRHLTLEAIRAIAELHPDRVVCLDDGFEGNDQLMVNAAQTFKTKGIVFQIV